MTWWRRLNEYVRTRRWPLVPFQPILYLFTWGAALRLWDLQIEPPAFDEVFRPGVYSLWLAMGVIGPPLALLSWVLIQKCGGRWRYVGMWTRLSADILVGTTLLTYHIVIVRNVLGQPITESCIFSRYMLGASIVFTIVLTLRDVWVIICTERLAGRIHRGWIDHER